MPAKTTDPISSMLQRTFGGLDHKREGLIRGGNSASARPFSVSVDKQLQSSAKHGLLAGSGNSMEGSIHFDSPTCFKSETKQSLLHPKVIVLNPKAAVVQQSKQTESKKEQNECAKEGFPQPKVTLF